MSAALHVLLIRPLIFYSEVTVSTIVFNVIMLVLFFLSTSMLGMLIVFIARLIQKRAD